MTRTESDFTCTIPAEARLQDLPERLPGLRVVEPLSGTNESAQCNGAAGYTSLLAGDPESVRVEVALREPPSSRRSGARLGPPS